MQNKVQSAQFESNTGGDYVARDVQSEIKSRNGATRIVTKRTTANKETKIIVNAQYIIDNFLFKDESLYTPRSDYGKMMKFLTTYTCKGKNKYDDVPDAMSMLALYVQNLRGNTAKILQRFF
jgi:predicted phage terminase large subunit-like protein